MLVDMYVRSSFFFQLLVESAFKFSILMMAGIQILSMSKVICHNNFSFILGCLVATALTNV